MTQQTFQINGRIIDRTTKKGIPDLQIEAWDKDLIFDDIEVRDRHQLKLIVFSRIH